MQITNIKRIVKEDFDQQNQNLVEKLAFSLNPLLDQLTQVFNKNIGFDNLQQELKTFDITVDAKGTPTSKTSLKTILVSKPNGVQVIRAISKSGIYPTTCPFISYTYNSADKTLSIDNITGLTTGTTWTITANLI